MGIKPQTAQLYSDICTRLQQSYAYAHARDPEEKPWRETPMDFCSWFLEQAKARSWSKKTFWLYRAAVAWHFGKNGPLEALEAIRAFGAWGLPSRGNRTASKKLKKLPQAILGALQIALERGLGELDAFIYLWLRVGVSTGLRPSEWENATFNSSNFSLQVQNAKHDQYRGNGKNRTIIFDPMLHREEIDDIQKFLAQRDRFLKHHTFKKLHERARKRLWYIGGVLWPRAMDRPSLYSARHQFAANMKKAGLSKREVAALMGHSSTRSATCHYARKRLGTEILPPSSPEDEVASVRQKDENKNFQFAKTREYNR